MELMNPNEKYLEYTIGQVVERLAREYPDKEMIKFVDIDRSWTWGGLDREADRIAKGLMALGIQRGDHVAVWATNVPEWITMIFATAKIGAVLVTVNTNYKKFEMEYLLKQSDCVALIMIHGFKDSNYVDIIRSLCPHMDHGRLDPSDKFPYLKYVITIGADTPEGMMNYRQLYQLGDTVSDRELAERKASLSCYDVINIQYTSGTTGFPKGVMLTHHGILNNAYYIGQHMNYSEDDRICVSVPFFHCFGLVLAVLVALTHGCSMATFDHFRPISVLETLQKEECTAVYGVPTMFFAVLNHPDFHKFRFPKLRSAIVGGSLCPRSLTLDMMGKMGITEIANAFGQTEVSPVATMTAIDDSLEKQTTTVGKALPYVETKVVDPETGEDLPCGQMGEFCVRGYGVMAGYYHMEADTASAIDADGWLHSGDLVMQQEDGYFVVTGRIKDMIIRGGENIYPKEIEEFLCRIPKIMDAQVIGVPDVEYGEVIMACIMLRNGEEMTEQEVKELVLHNMARHKVPSYVVFVDRYPMTASGKVQKYKLQEWAIEKLKGSSL